jgi:hypothetical protein
MYVYDSYTPQTFRTKLIGLTDVTRGYFEKLVDQLEKGFDDMEHTFGGAGAEEAALIEVHPANCLGIPGALLCVYVSCVLHVS